MQKTLEGSGPASHTTEPATLSTPDPGMCAVSRASEERKALESFRCLNSTADAAHSGSSPIEGVQASTYPPAVRPQEPGSQLQDRPWQRCSTS